MPAARSPVPSHTILFFVSGNYRFSYMARTSPAWASSRQPCCFTRLYQRLSVEIVVRDYLAGTTGTSILQMYKKGERAMYGHAFGEGLRDNEKLPQTIITPTTKGEHGEHDAPLSGADVVARKLLTQTQWDDV